MTLQLRWKRVQELLKAMGLEPGPIDGLVGPRTESALNRVVTPGAAVQEIADQLAVAALAGTDLTQQEMVTAMAQRALRDSGFDPGPTDGVAGPKTTDAIDRYRAAVGMAPGGAIDAALLCSLLLERGADA
jgi:peptidoglycan hydrolase-like protein with peptidoglycan-binding domain